MNATHPQTAQLTFEPWLEKAKRKFPGAIIHNSGQFAVAVMDHQNVYLFDDFFDTMDFMAGHPQYRLHDLAEEPVRKPNYGGLYRIPGAGQDEKD